jgi:hypothetical protein
MGADVAHAGSSSPVRLRLATLAGACLGAGFFVWITGVRPLDPTEVGWLMRGDWAQYYFSWHYLRVEPWHWPPGSIHGYYAPIGTTIGLTDAIPLAAFLLKPFGPVLPAAFQYLGPWLLLCFALQGALATRLIARWSGATAVQLLGAALFVLLPTLLTRVGHPALCAHWLILWALLVASRDPAHRFPVAEWAALGLVAGMIQPYIAAMALALLAAAALTGRGAPARARVVGMGAAAAAMAFGWWLSGMFALEGGGSLAAEGLGTYSMNLLAPVSPMGWSRVLPDLPIAGQGQAYEGFQYLGLGVLLLVAVAAVLVAAQRHRRDQAANTPRVWASLTVGVCLLMAALAVSPRVTFGDRVLADLRGPWSEPLALFRSSGRFFWPLAYLTLAWAVATIARRMPRAAAVSVVAAAVAVQAFDLHDVHAGRRHTARDPAFYESSMPVSAARWARIAPHYRHLVLATPPQCGAAPLPYESAVQLAAAHGLTVNAGTLARSDDRARRDYCAALGTEMDGGRLRRDTVYVVSPEIAERLQRTGGPETVCLPVDTIRVCTTREAYAAWRSVSEFDREP